MDAVRITTAKNFADTHFQFQHQFPNDHSELFDDIIAVLGCSEAEAENHAKTHCNMLSFYGGLYSAGFITISYKDFFAMMLQDGLCNDAGFFEFSKDAVCQKLFGFNLGIDHLTDYENVLNPSLMLDDNYFYQMLIHPEPDSDHFINTYIENNVLMGEDTSYRGNPFVVKDKIPAHEFGWLLKIMPVI